MDELAQFFPREAITSGEFARLVARNERNRAITGLGHSRLARAFNAIKNRFGDRLGGDEGIVEAVLVGIEDLWATAGGFDPDYDLGYWLVLHAFRAAWRIRRGHEEEADRLRFWLGNEPRLIREGELCVEPDPSGRIVVEEFLRSGVDDLTDEKHKVVAEFFEDHFLRFGVAPTIPQVAQHCGITGPQARGHVRHLRKHLARLLSGTSRRQP